MTLKRLLGKETTQYNLEQYEQESVDSVSAKRESMIGEIIVDLANTQLPTLYIANISGNFLPIAGGDFSSNNAAVMPYYIANTESYIVKTNLQGLFSYPITIEGELEVDGILIEVGGSSKNPTLAISGNTTAAINVNYIVDTDTAPITISLPAIPTIGDEVGIIDGTGNASVNNITVAGNGNKIAGLNANYIMNTDRRGLQFVFYNTAQGWILTEN